MMNSIVLVFANVALAISFFLRFYKLIRAHSALLEEISKENHLINKSYQTLTYIRFNVKEIAKQIHDDVDEELMITENVTRLSSKVADLVKRSEILKEIVIEFARSDPHKESIYIQTPNDIKNEFEKIGLC